VGVWHGLYVPAETPDAVVEKLTAALGVALEEQNVIDQLADLGAAPSSPEDATPEALTEQLSSQIDLWKPIIEESGVAAS
jgi:tripartite-type tricarboxylate transporter receptor subunit TctC